MGSGAARAVICLAVLLLLSPGRAFATPGLLVGVDDDTLKWISRPNSVYAIDRDLGLRAVRVTIPWQRGQSTPTALQQTYLHRVSLLRALGGRVVLAVFGSPADAPTTASARAQYCGFLAHVLARAPVRDVVVWNEVNSPSYWPQRAGAAAYERLLARCWDMLHAHRRSLNLISSTAAHHDPAGFVLALGAAYRASGRTRPIADTFGHNPYPDNSAEPPSAAHGPGTVAQGDLPVLLDAYHIAFGGTGQPPPGSGKVTIWYLEDGFQTVAPRGKSRLYNGHENDMAPLSAFEGGASDALHALPDQGSQLRSALQLAYCQPAVGAFFNFELYDENRLRGWQSGLLWRDGTRKPSYKLFKSTVAALAARTVDCSEVLGDGQATTGASANAGKRSPA